MSSATQSQPSDKVVCPTCGRDGFDTKRAMKIHHSRSHGERLVETTACEECGDEFKPDRPDVRYCSTECAADARREQISITCVTCEGVFEVSPSDAEGRKYCSMECRKNRITLTCDECGVTFETPKSREGERRFCSNLCRRTFGGRQTRGTYVTLSCEMCGEGFDVRESCADSRQFCSNECTCRYIGKQGSVEYETIRCETCCAEFSVQPRRADSARFCSRRCYFRGVRRSRFRPGTYPEASEYEKLVRKAYLYDALTIDETHRVVQTKLPDGEQYTRDDIEEHTDELLKNRRAVDTRLRNMRPEDLGLTPIGGER